VHQDGGDDLRMPAFFTASKIFAMSFVTLSIAAFAVAWRPVATPKLKLAMSGATETFASADTLMVTGDVTGARSSIFLP
jgi:hypothetical protein